VAPRGDRRCLPRHRRRVVRRLVHALYWDSDAASALVLAERLRGDGPVSIPHFGWWTSLWWLLATRGLPAHEHLWQASGYAFALAGVALVGWATARLAGRWAGAAAAAATVIAGPVALRSLLTVNFHVSTPFTAAVLAAYLVLLARRRARSRLVDARGFVLAAAVGVLAGANAASDPLLWLAGIAPFAIGGVVLAASARRLDVALLAGATFVVAVVSVLATSGLMHSLGFGTYGSDFRLADLADVPGNITKLGRLAALLWGANYALPGGYPREPVRALVALLVLAAIMATVVSPLRQIARRSPAPMLAYASF
jgi:hypothetical protein